MLKILQARLQQYMNRELPDVQTGFTKGRGTRDQIANICWTMEKARQFQKNTYFCFIDHAKVIDCVDHNKLWKILKEMGIPDYLNCFLRNLYADQKATVHTRHGIMDWFKVGKGVCQDCILSPCLFNFYVMAPHSSTLAWKIPWQEEPGRLQSMGSLRVGHDWVTSLSLFTFMHWRRKWQPTPVFSPGESQGRGSLVAAIYGVAQSQTRLKGLAAAAFCQSFI